VSDFEPAGDVSMHLLRIKVELSPVYLIESPEQILGSTVHIVATRVIRKVVSQG
jgi:hypothetical protein